VLHGDTEVPTAVDALRPGDIVALATGEPVRDVGRIERGSISVDQQQLTGESVPRALGPGDAVYAGLLALRGEARGRVTVAGRDTTLARVQRILREGAGHRDTCFDALLELSATWATPPCVRRITVTPKNLHNEHVGYVVAVKNDPVSPLRLITAITQLAALLRGHAVIRRLPAVDTLGACTTIISDKTGTLTTDALSVTEVVATGGWAPARVLAVAAAAEGRLTHPLAQALVTAAAQQSRCAPLHATTTDFTVGSGVSAIIDGEQVLVGGRRHLHDAGIPIDRGDGEGFAARVRRLLEGLERALEPDVVLIDSRAGLHETAAAGILHFLHDHGIAQVAMVSGDAEEPTRAQAQAFGLTEAYSNVLPEDKAALVKRLQAAGRRVCFIGDGVNDALAMRQADCAISLHGGADLATDTAGKTDDAAPHFPLQILNDPRFEQFNPLEHLSTVGAGAIASSFGPFMAADVGDNAAADVEEVVGVVRATIHIPDHGIRGT